MRLTVIIDEMPFVSNFITNTVLNLNSHTKIITFKTPFFHLIDKPDLIIVDSKLIQNGIEHYFAFMRECYRDAKIVIFSAELATLSSKFLYNKNIDGIISKLNVVEDIAAGFHEVFCGNPYYCEISKCQLNSKEKSETSFLEGFDKLSTREVEVLRQLTCGLHPNEIAKTLCISPKTVINHKYSLMKKLNISSAVELVCKFREIEF